MLFAQAIRLLMNTWFAKQEEYKGRLKICRDCEFLNSVWQCRQCLCFMPAKARLAASYCPIHKWGRATLTSKEDPNPAQERIDLDQP